MKQLGLSLTIIGLLLILILFELLYYIPLSEEAFLTFLLSCFVVLGFGVIVAILGYWDEGFGRD